MVRKLGGNDNGKLYAMKVLKKATIVQKAKTTEHIKTERQVLASVRQSPFLCTLYYAFQTDTKLHLILEYIKGGELFTHLFKREHFNENEVRFYIGEITLALEHLHKLGIIYRYFKSFKAKDYFAREKIVNYFLLINFPLQIKGILN